MKVICIDDNWENDDPDDVFVGSPVEGERYTVTGVFLDDNTVWYELEECDEEDLYEARSFVQLPDIEEVTVKEEDWELVCY